MRGQSPVGDFLRSRAAYNRHAWQTVHPVRLIGRALLFTLCTLMLLAAVVAPGWSSVGYMTQPKPETFIVNFLVAWSLGMFLWSASMHSIISACACGLAEETTVRTRGRMAALFILRFNGMTAFVAAVLMLVKTFVWWASWQ